jgi:hypothetical protein
MSGLPLGALPETLIWRQLKPVLRAKVRELAMRLRMPKGYQIPPHTHPNLKSSPSSQEKDSLVWVRMFERDLSSQRRRRCLTVTPKGLITRLIELPMNFPKVRVVSCVG